MLQEVTSTSSSKAFAQRADRSLITEAELMGMDEAEYMSSEQLAFFKAKLDAQAEMLASRARFAATELAIASSGADPADRASAEEEHTLALSNRVRDAAQLLEVRAALRRIESGEFGWCDQTGEMIGIRRLLACPTTVLSIEAQTRAEDHQRRYKI